MTSMKVWPDLITLTGTEFDLIPEVHEFDWDFGHLNEALESGSLLGGAPEGSKVYLFGVTEPQMVEYSEEKAAAEKRRRAREAGEEEEEEEETTTTTTQEKERTAAARPKRGRKQAPAPRGKRARRGKGKGKTADDDGASEAEAEAEENAKEKEKAKAKGEESAAPAPAPTGAFTLDMAIAACATAPKPAEEAEEEAKEEKLIAIPAVVAIVSTMEPPSKIGLASVQMEGEEIVPFRRLGMDWVPLVAPGSRLEKQRPTVFTLHQRQRKTAVRRMKSARLAEFTYALPYIYNPFHPKANLMEGINTFVTIKTTIGEKNVEAKCDLPDLLLPRGDPAVPPEQFVSDIMEDYELAEETRADLQKLVDETIAETRTRVNKERQERRNRKAALHPREVESLQALRTYKFYPQNSYPDLGKFRSSLINRYYLSANEVRPPVPVNRCPFAIQKTEGQE